MSTLDWRVPTPDWTPAFFDDGVELLPVMNDAKWEKLRRAMASLGPDRPCWRSTSASTGAVYLSDSDWAYHFGLGGYKDLLHVDIAASDATRELVRQALKRVHVPGTETATGFRISGYIKLGQPVDFI